MYPNPALSAWQLALIAVVAASTLAGWLVAVFLAARPDRAASTSASAERTSASAAADGDGTGQPQRSDEAADRLAA